MTGLATDPFFHVDRMIEIDKIGQIMHPEPFQGLVILIAGPNRFEHRIVGGKMTVTTDTGFGRRNTGKIRLFDRGMAIAAVKPHPNHVLLVTERHGLGLSDAHLGHIRGPEIEIRQPGHAGEDQYKPHDSDSGDYIHARRKYLRHANSYV
jgi:hypothetical protein